jgi:hypothetical protein
MSCFLIQEGGHSSSLRALALSEGSFLGYVLAPSSEGGSIPSLSHSEDTIESTHQAEQNCSN